MSTELPSLRQSRFFEWMVLAVVLMISFLISNLIMAVLLPQLGIGDLTEALQQFANDPDADLVSAFRILQIVGQFFLFTFPALMFVSFVYRERAFLFLHLNRFPGLRNLLIGIMILILAYPITQATYWLNQQIPLPDWLTSNDENNQKMTEAFMKMENVQALVMNLIAMALLPAIGEELLFRGIIQKLIGKLTLHAHKAIWITAFFFSAMHMEAAGFLPRLLLGALLGYLLYWTNSLWVPIIAHFVNNAAQIIAQYYYVKGAHELDLESIEYLPWGISLVSVILVSGVCYYLVRSNREAQESYEASMGLNGIHP